jgi:hypothetical protein
MMTHEATRGLESVSYIGELLSTLLHTLVYVVFTQFAECTGIDCKLHGITEKKRKGKAAAHQLVNSASC